MAGELVLITGTTGFIGFAVLLTTLRAGHEVSISVRRASQAEELKAHPLIAPFASKLSSVVVPDITVEGAFDSASEGVEFVQHVANPLPKPTEDSQNDIILPAIHGTTSILNSALKDPSIRRVVITSSVVALLSDAAASSGSSIPLTPRSRRASKALTLDATDRFLTEKKPHFSIVNIMPGYVIGRNELVTSSKGLLSGSNAIVFSIVLGTEPAPGKLSRMGAYKRPLMMSHVNDVARVQVEALDEKKVVLEKGESRGFLIDGGKGAELDDAKEIARKAFPEAVKDGKLKLGGSIGSAKLVIEAGEMVEVFGELKSYEVMVTDVVVQYLELLGKEGE